MTVKELASVMGSTWIAISEEGKGRVSYSGRADEYCKEFHHLAKFNVISVVPRKKEGEATCITCKWGK